MTTNFTQHVPLVSGFPQNHCKGFSPSGNLRPSWSFSTTLPWGFTGNLTIIASGK